MLTAVKVKNRISKLNLASTSPVAIEYINFSNIKVNGQTRGASGFIKNLANGVTVYVCTEQIPCIGDKIMYRYAKDGKDYRGCMNHWSKEVDYCSDVYHALLNSVLYEREKNCVI